MKKINLQAKWIWCPDNTRLNDFVLFKKELLLESIPSKAPAYIGVDTRYWLKINAYFVVREGGL